MHHVPDNRGVFCGIKARFCPRAPRHPSGSVPALLQRCAWVTSLFSSKHPLAGNGSGMNCDSHHSHSYGHGPVGRAQLFWPIQLMVPRWLFDHAHLFKRLKIVIPWIKDNVCLDLLLRWQRTLVCAVQRCPIRWVSLSTGCADARMLDADRTMTMTTAELHLWIANQTADPGQKKRPKGSSVGVRSWESR